MFGAILILICTALWATDAIFRLPLARAVDANTIVLLEHFICVVVTLPLFIVRSGETRYLRFRGWVAIAFIGLLGSAAGTYLFTASYRYINPSVTILLQKLQPIFAVIAARILLKEVPPRGFYKWGLLAIISSTMVSLPELWRWEQIRRGFPDVTHLLSPANQNNIGIEFALGAAFVWGLSTVFGKWVTKKVSFPVTSFLRFGWGLIGMLILTTINLWVTKDSVGGLFVFFYTDPQAVKSILYLGLVPGALAMYFYYAGLKRTKASAAAFAEMFFPVAAVMMNWRVLGRGLELIQLFGMGLLLVAVFCISRAPKPKPPKWPPKGANKATA